jgi:iron complex outermembrane receptor protein
LINGRVADSPIFGGSEFLRLPLLLEDIKQVEILRGPSAAAWGANAFNGAINIITKSPEECQGVLVSSSANHFGDNYHRLRWADATDRWGWRVSSAYEDVASSTDVLDLDFVTRRVAPMAFESQDFRRAALVDTELRHRLSDQTSLSLGFGHSDMETGGYEFLYSFPDSDATTETTRAFSKLEKVYEDNRRLYAQWYGNFARNDWPSLGNYSSSENQFEGQWDFIPHENHRATVGTNLRLSNINQDVERPDDILLGDARAQRVGAYLMDRWRATDRLSVDGLFYGEWYSETDADWAVRLGTAYALDPQARHLLRFGGAKSYRTPLAALRDVSTERLGGAVRVFPGSDLKNEEIWSLEGGYSTRLSETATFRLDTYYQEYRDLIGFRSPTSGQYTADNLGPAEAYGWESELALRGEFYKVSFWYAYNYFAPQDRSEQIDPDGEVRAFLPARHKAGATLRFFLPDHWTVNLNYKHSTFTDGTHGPWGGDVPGFDRLDLTLARQFKLGKADGELLLGISDLFNDTEQIVGDQGSVTHLHETPGRTFFARLALRF